MIPTVISDHEDVLKTLQISQIYIIDTQKENKSQASENKYAVL